jgi:hypothetical protein
MQFKIQKIAPTFIGLLVLSILPFSYAKAGTDFTVSGWIPYWRDSEGIKDAKKHISQIDTLYPFAFTVKSDSSISDQANLTDKEWTSFIKFARGKKVEVIPTVMWSSGKEGKV